MKLLRNIAALALVTGVAACGSVETASRNAPLEAPAPVQHFAAMSIADFKINVSRGLKVSEAKRYYPGGDIVWRGEPLGDRHLQVARIFQESVGKSQALGADGYPVNVVINVKRFHAITEKARYTVGGVHSITFDMMLTDPRTGLQVGETRTIKADLEAFGGARAINAERNGISQKYRITNHLAQVLHQEMTSPDGNQTANLGFFQAINDL